MPCPGRQESAASCPRALPPRIAGPAVPGGVLVTQRLGPGVAGLPNSTSSQSQPGDQSLKLLFRIGSIDLCPAPGVSRLQLSDDLGEVDVASGQHMGEQGLDIRSS